MEAVNDPKKVLADMCQSLWDILVLYRFPPKSENDSLALILARKLHQGILPIEYSGIQADMNEKINGIPVWMFALIHDTFIAFSSKSFIANNKQAVNVLTCSSEPYIERLSKLFENPKDQNAPKFAVNFNEPVATPWGNVTALMLCMYKGFTKSVDVLLDKYKVDTKGILAFAIACGYKRFRRFLPPITLIDKKLGHLSIDDHKFLGLSAAEWAIEKRSFDAVSALLEVDANVFNNVDISKASEMMRSIILRYRKKKNKKPGTGTSWKLQFFGYCCAKIPDE